MTMAAVAVTGRMYQHRIYMEYGWNRFLPDGAIALLSSIAFEELDTAELDLRLRDSEHTPDGLNSPAWSPLEVYTDEALAELRTLFDDTPLENAADEAETAEEVMALEAAARADELQRMRRFSEHLGLPEVRTLGDLLSFMAEVGLVTSRSSGVWSLNPTAPLPDEALPLTVQQRKHEDELRWALLHERSAQAIIRLFRPDAIAPADKVTTTLVALSKELDIPVAAAREAIAELVRGSDFSVDHDPTTRPEGDTLTITVDWEAFYASRIHLTSSDD